VAHRGGRSSDALRFPGVVRCGCGGRALCAAPWLGFRVDATGRGVARGEKPVAEGPALGGEQLRVGAPLLLLLLALEVAWAMAAALFSAAF
jgi:hypothetical protein